MTLAVDICSKYIHALGHAVAAARIGVAPTGLGITVPSSITQLDEGLYEDVGPRPRVAIALGGSITTFVTVGCALLLAGVLSDHPVGYFLHPLLLRDAAGPESTGVEFFLALFIYTSLARGLFALIPLSRYSDGGILFLTFIEEIFILSFYDALRLYYRGCTEVGITLAVLAVIGIPALTISGAVGLAWYDILFMVLMPCLFLLYGRFGWPLEGGGSDRMVF